MIEPLFYLGISLLFAGLIVWAIMPLVLRRAVQIIESRQQVTLRSLPTLKTDRADAAIIQDLEDTSKQLGDKVASQSCELDRNAETITQLTVDRDILKIQLDTLRIQQVGKDQNRDIINRL